VTGHYWIGKDIKENRHSLIGWGETAEKLLAHMPPEVTDRPDVDATQIISIPDATFVPTGRELMIGGAAPLIINATDDSVALGRAAWQRRKADGRQCWEDWKLIGEALLVGRQQAMALASAKKPTGKSYNRHFGQWLQIHGFDDIDSGDRAKLLVLMENLPEVEAYRATLGEAQRAKWNSPSTVWRAWKCQNRGGRFRDQQANQQANATRSADAMAPSPEAASDPEAEERKTLGRLLVDLNKLIGVVKDLREFSGEINDVALDTLVRMAEELATEWPQTAALLKERQRQRQQRAA
jgi:hypothetical protein